MTNRMSLLIFLLFSLIGRIPLYGQKILLANTNVKDALIAADGRLWAACAASGVAVREGKTWRTYSPLNSKLANSHPLRLLEFDDAVWTSLYSSGLWVLKESDWQGPLPKGIETPVHTADCVNWRGNLWLTLGERLGSLDSSRSFEGVHPPLPPGRGAMATCMTTTDLTLLVGTNIHQILQFDGRSWAIHDFKGRLRGKHIRSIATVGDDIWFGTFGGLYVYRAPELRSIEPRGLSPFLVTSIIATNGQLWVGTWGKGVFRQKDGKWVRGVKGNSTRGLFVNCLRHRGDLVYACTTRGIHVLAGSIAPLSPAPASASSASP